MALAALGKFVQYPLWMRVWMTRIAWWHGLVFVLVAKDTGKIMVLGRILCQQVHCLLMTGPAIRRWGVLGIGNYQRHMNRMARHAGLKIHILGVFFVALRTVRNLPVCCVALVTGQIRVGARVLFDLVTLLLVTCKTRSGDLAFQLQIKGSVGVSVTTCTPLQLIMGLPAVADTALRYGACTLGWMLLMTVQTANLGPVFLSAGCYGLRLLGVAYYTVRIGQSRDIRLCLNLLGCCGRRPNASGLLTSKDANQSDYAKNANDNPN